jgi:hypothetical protein
MRLAERNKFLPGAKLEDEGTLGKLALHNEGRHAATCELDLECLA